MTVTAEDIKAKKADVLAKNLLSVQAANAALAARNAVAVAQGELQVLQAQKQIEDESGSM